MNIKSRHLYLFISLLLANTFSMAQTYKSVSAEKGLPIGAKVSLFKAQDQRGNTYSLSEALKKGPVVLLFYRGLWCPVCNKHLSQLQDSLLQIYDKGATAVAISPEKTEFLKKTAEKTHASFTLLFDKAYKIENAFDVTYEPGALEINSCNNILQAQLDKAQSDNRLRLPIPATFIIDTNGIIMWRQFNPDFHVRASVKDILNHIPRS